MFSKNEYIVLLERIKSESSGILPGYVYKQRINSDTILKPYIDTRGSISNGFTIVNREQTIWRYATDLEKEYYDLKRKPHNILCNTSIPINHGNTIDNIINNIKLLEIKCSK